MYMYLGGNSYPYIYPLLSSSLLFLSSPSHLQKSRENKEIKNKILCNTFFLGQGGGTVLAHIEAPAPFFPSPPSSLAVLSPKPVDSNTNSYTNHSTNFTLFEGVDVQEHLIVEY